MLNVFRKEQQNSGTGEWFDDYELGKKSLIQDQADVLNILQRCCGNELPVQLFIPHEQLYMEASFLAVSDAHVHLKIPTIEHEDKIPVLAVCLVFFNSGSQATSFLSWIRECKAPDGSRSCLILSLSFPEALMTMQARNAFRIPLHEISGFSVKLIKDGKEHQATANNLSLGGVLARLQEDSPFEIGDDLKVILGYGELTAELPAKIRWIRDSQIGIFFAKNVRDGELDPSNCLLRIVREVERDYIRIRAKKAG